MSKEPLDDFSGADFGTIPEGWTRDGWLRHLRGLIVACRDLRPDRADYYRHWVQAIETKTDVSNGD